MLIKEVVFNNFRIYKGLNILNILPYHDKNIIVVSGKNGFGKTTFLMGLVWCLYGRQMEKVDELYSKEISDKGGYGKYIATSLNLLAKAEGQTKFSVSVIFTDVKIPDITSNEIKITRSYDTITGTSDEIEVLIDRYTNELIVDLGNSKQKGEEIFIRDFLLPLEIAKFFFFDAEKIVSLAEINSLSQRQQLSQAYSEVLGIKKYEDLKLHLERLQDDYRRESANPKEKEEFNNLIAAIKNCEIKIDELEQQKDNLQQERTEKRHESSLIQEKLIREGNQMTLEQLNQLKFKEDELKVRLNSLQDELKDIFDLVPFGLAGELIFEISNQLESESIHRKNKFLHEDVEKKIKKILENLEEEKSKSSIVFHDIEIRDFYEKQIRLLIKKHFYSDIDELPSDFEPIHDFSEVESNEYKSMVNDLRLSFSEKFSKINNEFYQAKLQIDSIRRRIRDAEKNAENEYIRNLREDKDKLDQRVREIDKSLDEINMEIGSFKNEMKSFRQKKEELSKKIDVSKANKKLDNKAQDLTSTLKEFIVKFKEEKKKSLEKRILDGLNTLMHKKDFVKKVIVDISVVGDDVDINLYNKRKEKIDKGSLSMGERQMYASALLKALVEESDIKFPVFIDSPMQKFDEDHALNIIRHFYPNVSDQVVLFPIMNKELTKNEFNLLKHNISKSFFINNVNTDYSNFYEVESENLMTKYEEIYNGSN